jgi:hypothetical protein
MASPKSRLRWVLWIHVCPWFILTPKALKLRTNQLVVWFVQVRVNSWCLSFFLIPISELQYTSLPPKCYELWNMPQLLTLPMFSFHTHLNLSKSLGTCQSLKPLHHIFNNQKIVSFLLLWTFFLTYLKSLFELP